MLGGLFNRKEQERKIELLQTRINELEYENKSLSEHLSAQASRAKKALADKQEADLALKKAEGRIVTIERELKNLKKEEDAQPSVRDAVTLTADRASDLLFQICSLRSRNDDLLTAYLRPEETVNDLDGFELDNSVKYMIARIESPTGIAVFYDMKRTGMVPQIVAPPFMIPESRWKLDNTFDTTQLQEILDTNRVICILLAHAGESFIGISDRERVIEYKIVRSSVKEKHTKGGMSQRRFERLRDEDIRHHGEKARSAFEALIAGYKSELEMVVASGEHNLIKMITQDNEFPLLLRSIDPKAVLEKQNIDKIRVLVWSSRWYVL
ncbi:MAG: Vms1/Ankzf1 family peptidyl-tRNA hydrolase [Halobacteriota archaeon]